MRMHVGSRSVQNVRMVLNLKERLWPELVSKKFSGHKRNTSYLAICVYAPIFTEYKCTVKPVHDEHRREEIMATVSK
jgi:hypothetical protein